MPYAKLDVGILDSSLWPKRDDRDVFITAMLMAKPYELEAPAPQLRVDGLEPTGFVVPPGWYGLVEAAGPGIVRRAEVSPSEGMAALVRLGEPEAESRSQAFEGRRLVRIDGGYLVLNFIEYRDKDHTAADRMKRYRQRKKAAKQAQPESVTPSRTVTGRNAPSRVTPKTRWTPKPPVVSTSGSQKQAHSEEEKVTRNVTQAEADLSSSSSTSTKQTEAVTRNDLESDRASADPSPHDQHASGPPPVAPRRPFHGPHGHPAVQVEKSPPALDHAPQGDIATEVWRALQEHDALAEVSTYALAQTIAKDALPRMTPIAWLKAAIGDAARKAGAKAAVGEPLPRADLAVFVTGCCARASPPAAPTSTARPYSSSRPADPPPKKRPSL